nr:coiled-coil domain-containing protein 61-like [Onthophagus taurus]
MSEPNLITSAVLQGKEYLVKMNISNKCLELVICDKQSGEEWQCSYDQAYIENLTHKTGNFKQYDVFVTMIKSGLLKTSDSISLQLLTFEDLDTLRTKKLRCFARNFNNPHGNNRRYLIITYSVEFDRIHYPLPLEYCGPPDPKLLQSTIQKLEAEISNLKDELSTKHLKPTNQILILEKRVDDLTLENADLKAEISQLHRVIDENEPRSKLKSMQKAIINLEKSVLSERKSHHRLVDKLRTDKIRLINELERCKSSEKSLRSHLDQISNKSKSFKPKRDKSDLESLQTIFRRTSPNKSKSEDVRKNFDARSISPRQVKSEGCNLKPKTEKVRKKVSKPRSVRSSSTSSSRNLETFFALACVDHGQSPTTSSSSSSRRRRDLKSETKRSRSSSRNSSENSYSDRSYKPTSLKGVKSRLRSSDRDFLALENRILKLQDILKDSKTNK